MKKVFLLATAALLVSGVSFAEGSDKGKKCKKSCCTKSGKSCSKSCSKDKEKKEEKEKTAQ